MREINVKLEMQHPLNLLDNKDRNLVTKENLEAHLARELNLLDNKDRNQHNQVKLVIKEPREAHPLNLVDNKDPNQAKLVIKEPPEAHLARELNLVEVPVWEPALLPKLAVNQLKLNTTALYISLILDINMLC
jgi:hypothetical protein